MKLTEVTRPSDKAAEREKLAAKQEAMRNRVVNAYVRGLTAPQYKPHANDVCRWLFGIGQSDEEAMNELLAWTAAVGFMVDVDPNQEPKGADFKAFSQSINIPHDMIDFVCSGGLIEEPKK